MFTLHDLIFIIPMLLLFVSHWRTRRQLRASQWRLERTRNELHSLRTLMYYQNAKGSSNVGRVPREIG